MIEGEYRKKLLEFGKKIDLGIVIWIAFLLWAILADFGIVYGHPGWYSYVAPVLGILLHTIFSIKRK